MSNLRLTLGVVIAAVAALGCDGQQYVSPDTVALAITTEGGASRLNSCHYVPVLLGSRAVVHYLVDQRLDVTFDLSRDEISVSFESPDGPVEPFRVQSKVFADGATESDPAPPAGYVVELTSPCDP